MVDEEQKIADAATAAPSEEQTLPAAQTSPQGDDDAINGGQDLSSSHTLPVELASAQGEGGGQAPAASAEPQPAVIETTQPASSNETQPDALLPNETKEEQSMEQVQPRSNEPATVDDEREEGEFEEPAVSSGPTAEMAASPVLQTAKDEPAFQTTSSDHPEDRMENVEESQAVITGDDASVQHAMPKQEAHSPSDATNTAFPESSDQNSGHLAANVSNDVQMEDVSTVAGPLNGNTLEAAPANATPADVGLKEADPLDETSALPLPVSTPPAPPAPAPASVAPTSAAPVAPAPPPAVASSASAAPSNRSRQQDEMVRVRRENEDMRLMWLSLPSHDHPTYYSDTDEEASSSSSVADAVMPRNVAGRAPFLSGRFGDRGGSFVEGRKRRQDDWPLDEDRDSSDGDADEDVGRAISQQERMYRGGNRGNKLHKESRWVRTGKLGTSSEARSEKDIHERFTARLKALQRTQVQSLLNAANGPPLPSKDLDMLEGSDRLLLRDVNMPLPVEESSTLLAPQLLRPILSARALLESHTLRHTFRNPHIGALSSTALDLRESESHLSRALAHCLGAMETVVVPMTNGAAANGVSFANNTLPSTGADEGQSADGHSDRQPPIDALAIGVEGTQGTEDELNPSFAQLDRLFVTKDGLPIPFGGGGSEDGQMPLEQQQQQQQQGGEGWSGQPQAMLSAVQQRDVVRAALECLHELGADSLEYVERLDEVRSRLAAVKQKRMQVWNALRTWALKREGEVFDGPGDMRGGYGNAQRSSDGALAVAAAAPAAADTTVTASGGRAAGQPKTTSGSSASRSGKRQRV